MADQPLPPLPDIPIGSDFPQTLIIRYNDGAYFVTKNLNGSDAPEYRHYKRLGWALRYAGISKSDWLKSISNPIDLFEDYQ